jgi:hypothetical protein
VLGCIRFLASGSAEANLADFGVTDADIGLLQSDETWLGSDRLRATRVLDAVVHGSLDRLGLPRFNVSAEYIAAAIWLCVKPVNMMVACVWMARGAASAEDEVAHGEALPVSPRELHALLCTLEKGDVAALEEFRAKFEAKIEGRLVNAPVAA